MNISIFNALAHRLLKTHYGISLSDTALANGNAAAEAISAGIRPYQAVNAEAEKHDLTRIDVTGFFGAAEKKLLTMQDEVAALAIVNPVFLLDDEQPTTCPHCGSRTDFDELDTGGHTQHHRCLNVSTCGFEFIAEEEEENNNHEST